MMHWCRRVQSRAVAYQLVIFFESVKNASIATKDPLESEKGSHVWDPVSSIVVVVKAC